MPAHQEDQWEDERDITASRGVRRRFCPRTSHFVRQDTRRHSYSTECAQCPRALPEAGGARSLLGRPTSPCRLSCSAWPDAACSAPRSLYFLSFWFQLDEPGACHKPEIRKQGLDSQGIPPLGPEAGVQGRNQGPPLTSTPCSKALDPATPFSSGVTVAGAVLGITLRFM